MPKYRRRFPVKLRESAASATAERVEVREATLAEPGSGGRMLVQLIDEGWGSSGFYSASVLREAASRKVFGKNLRVFANHPGLAEEDDRPERSVLDWVGQLTEDARYDPVRRGLVAEAEIFDHWQHIFCKPKFSSALGMSVRASGIAEHGEAEGRHGMLISEIKNATSVDFVTAAGRGGKVLALLESARTRLNETPASQIRAAIERAVKDAYGGPDIYVWLREYDPDRGLAWFEIGEGAVESCWEQQYASNGTDAVLLGPRTQVVAETVYRPVAASVEAMAPPPFAAAYVEAATPDPEPATTDPGGTPPAETNTTEEEPGMSGTQTGTAPAPAGTNTPVSTLSEADASRITSERDTALREAAESKQRADAAQGELARYRAGEQAAPIVDRILAESGLPVAAVARVRAGVLGQVPLTESGALDETRLRTIAEAETAAEKAYVAQLAESAGAGRVSGFGATSAPPQQPVSNVAPWAQVAPEPDAALISAYRERGLSESAATAAARGRAV